MSNIKRFLTVLIALFLVVAAANAQSNKRIRVYLHNGAVDTLLMQNGSSIAHSRLDLQGQEHDDIVSIIISNVNTVPVNFNVSVEPRQYLIADIDSIVTPNGKRVVFRAIDPSVPVPVNVPVNSTVPVRRTSFSGTFPGTAASGNVIFYWTENDHIRLDVGDESRAETLTGDKRGADFIFDDLDDSVGSYVVYYPDKTVTIPTVQTQSGADNTDHIGRSGDCGTATATRQQDGTYSFTLDHKAAYLCFLPHINHLPSVRLTKIELSCSSNIAGDYQVGKSGLYGIKNGSKTIALKLFPQRERDFILGHSYLSEQDSIAAYMVTAPQDGSRAYNALYYLTDTLTNISHVYRHSFSFQPQANTVYPIECNIREADFVSVDMGLSVNWASRNIGVDTPNEYGIRYASDAEANAAMLEQTVVTQWLMPTQDQRDELLEKCQWTLSSSDGKPGYMVTAPSAARDDGNIHRLFFPFPPGITTMTPEECLSANSRPVEALAVDLGLKSGLLWATKNVGAVSPEDYGDYYAWGETEPKTDYSTDTYLYGTQNLGNGANHDISGTQHDPAFVQWGRTWRMPTYDEMLELIDSCNWTWNTINGVSGFLIEKKTSGTGQRIFLPAGGFYNGTSPSYQGSGGSYFTSIQSGNNSEHAYSLGFRPDYNSGYRYLGGNEWRPFYYGGDCTYRRYGRSIRAVMSPVSETENGTALIIQTDSVRWHLGDNNAILYGTLSSALPIKGDVTVGFVIGDSATITKNKSRFEWSETVSSARSFSYSQPVYGNIGYWYRAYAETADTIIYGEARQYGYMLVDLGLSVRWASMNLGASQPEDFGDYYAWGETEPKVSYTQNNYKYGVKALGNGANFDIKATKYDAARINMGDVWRLPTDTEMSELINNCDWTWTSINGVSGFKVMSRKNNNYIFMPAAGFYNGSGCSYKNSGGSYRTSIPEGYDSNHSWSMGFRPDYNSGYRYLGGNEWRPFYYGGDCTYRYFGRSIRAVDNINAVTESGIMLQIMTDSASWNIGDTSATIYAALGSTTPLDGSVTVGFIIGDSLNITLEKDSLAYSKEITETGGFSTSLSIKDNIGWWYRAFLKIGDEVFYGEAKHVGWEMVDLGLPSGTLWSNVNLGSTVPEEYGDYYAWGEVTPKASYSRDNYDYLNQTIGNNGNISATAYDAAYVNLGNAWCMPTDTQMQELINNCNWTWTAINGVRGYKVSSQVSGNSNYIFLPAAGFYDGTTLRYESEGGSYRTSIYGGSNNGEHAWTMGYRFNYNSGYRYLGGNEWRPFYYNGDCTYRYFGRSIRPVAVRKRQ